MKWVKTTNRDAAVNKDNNTEDSLSGYKDVFKGFSCLEGEQLTGGDC